MGVDFYFFRWVQVSPVSTPLSSLRFFPSPLPFMLFPCCEAAPSNLFRRSDIAQCVHAPYTVLKVVWKSWGLPLTSYPSPLSTPSIYHPTPSPELRAGGWAPRAPYFKPWPYIKYTYRSFKKHARTVFVAVELCRLGRLGALPAVPKHSSMFLAYKRPLLCGDNRFEPSEHSQESKDPVWYLFCDSWPDIWPFDPK